MVGGIAAIFLGVISILLLRKRQRVTDNDERSKPETSSIVIPKHELESPLSSPGFLGPLEKEKMAEFEAGKEERVRGGLVELETPHLSTRAELEAHNIRRKPVPELP